MALASTTWTRLAGLARRTASLAAEFEDDYELLVKRYLDMPSHPKILVATPIPYPQGKNAAAYLKPMTTIVLPAVTKVARAHQLPLIDLYGTFFDQPSGFFKDDLHLSDEQGLQKEAEVVYAAIQASMMPVGGNAGAGVGGAAGDAAIGGLPAIGGTSASNQGGVAGGGGAAGGPVVVSSMGGSASGASGANLGGRADGGAGAFAGAAVVPVSALGTKVDSGSGCSTRGNRNPGSTDTALLVMSIAVTLLRRRRVRVAPIHSAWAK